jgi:glycosyltransferase involved in cell wall biosynthesis
MSQPHDLELTIFFPVYKDEESVERVIRKSFDVAQQVSSSFEIIVVNDGTPDRAGEIADRVAQEMGPQVRVIHHPTNLGYGAAIRTGLTSSRGAMICFTDGDDEYDIYDLEKLYKLKDHYDLVITFRYVKLYSGYRQFISWVYNHVVRFAFKSKFRDISTGLRLIRKPLVAEVLPIISNSPFVGAEITIKTMLKGFRIGEMGIQTFPREFGRGSSTSVKNIIATIRDLWTVRKTIFSEYYDTSRRQPSVLLRGKTGTKGQAPSNR